MDIGELFKMISSIDQKKGKCRGDLRLKVLLKTTHDYARRSWIDGKSGNPQKLQIMLRNSVMKHPSSDLDSEITVKEESSTVTSQEQLQSAQRIGPIEKSSVSNNALINETKELEQDSSDEFINDKSDINHGKKLPSPKPRMKNPSKFGKIKDFNLLKRIRCLKKSGNKKKILKALEVHFQRNNENQDFGQQEINKNLLKRIKKLLKIHGTKHQQIKFVKTRKSQKRKFSDVSQDDCEELLDLDEFFNKLKRLKCSDDSSL